jgi:hypothetical protein
VVHDPSQVRVGEGNAAKGRIPQDFTGRRIRIIPEKNPGCGLK